MKGVSAQPIYERDKSIKTSNDAPKNIEDKSVPTRLHPMKKLSPKEKPIMAKTARKTRTKGSMPSSTKDLLRRCRKIGLPITRGGSGHPRIWLSGKPRTGPSITVPYTSSDCRSMLNNIMLIRSYTGIDLRTI